MSLSGTISGHTYTTSVSQALNDGILVVVGSGGSGIVGALVVTAALTTALDSDGVFFVVISPADVQSGITDLAVGQWPARLNSVTFALNALNLLDVNLWTDTTLATPIGAQVDTGDSDTWALLRSGVNLEDLSINNYATSLQQAAYFNVAGIAPSGPTCFLRGTLVACPGGERPIEELSEGDLVQQPDGSAVPVVALKRSHWDLAAMPTYQPRLVPAGTRAGVAVAVRDLVLTGNHGVFMSGGGGTDETPVPAGRIVGSRRAALSGVMHLHHLQLPLSTHVITANGVPCESWRSSGSDKQGWAHAT